MLNQQPQKEGGSPSHPNAAPGHSSSPVYEEPKFAPEYAPDPLPLDEELEFEAISGASQPNVELPPGNRPNSSSQGNGDREQDPEALAAFYSRLEKQNDKRFQNQKKANFEAVFEPESLIYYIDHPVEFIEDVFPNPDPPADDPEAPLQLEEWQKRVCRTIADDDRGFVAVAAGSGVGKTWLLSKLIYWFLTTRKGVIPCTAPTEHQLFDILWKELKKDWDSSPDLQKIFTWTQTKLFVNGHVATWYAVARTATVRKDGKVQEGLQGFHDRNLFYIVDEASGVADSSMAAVDGALTAHNAKIIMTSNPTRISGRFYNAFTRSSIEKGGPWLTLRVDARDSRFVSPKYVSMMLHEHGEDSAVFKAKVSGEFPDQEENALLSLTDVERIFTGASPSLTLAVSHNTADSLSGASRRESGSVGSSTSSSTGATPLSPSSPHQHLVEGQEDALEDLLPVRTPDYRSKVFSSEEHEYAAMSFYNKIGFKGLLDGQWPSGRRVVVGISSYSRPRRFYPPDNFQKRAG